jgi:hypothetical protein
VPEVVRVDVLTLNPSVSAAGLDIPVGIPVGDSSADARSKQEWARRLLRVRPQVFAQLDGKGNAPRFAALAQDRQEQVVEINV